MFAGLFHPSVMNLVEVTTASRSAGALGVLRKTISPMEDEDEERCLDEVLRRGWPSLEEELRMLEEKEEERYLEEEEVEAARGRKNNKGVQQNKVDEM